MGDKNLEEFRGPRGDSSRHLSREAIESGFAALPPPPKDLGRVTLIVSRGEENGVRETPHRVRLTPEEGVPGDAWLRDVPDKPEAQITVMRTDVASLFANGQPLSLFGDNLLADLDLSAANLPAGTRLRAGGVLLEVTPEPHTGCRKFRQRVGHEALRLTARRELRDQHLRGIYVRVVEPGEVAVGDRIEVLSRGGECPVGVSSS